MSLTISQLPPDLNRKVLSYLKPATVCKLGEVSKFFLRMVNDPQIWQTIARDYHIDLKNKVEAKKEVFATITWRNNVAAKFLTEHDSKVWEELGDYYYPFGTVSLVKNPFEQHEAYRKELFKNSYNRNYARGVLFQAQKNKDVERVGYLLKQGAFCKKIDPDSFLYAANILSSLYNEAPEFILEALQSMWKEFKTRFSDKEIKAFYEQIKDSEEYLLLFRIRKIAELVIGAGYSSVKDILEDLTLTRFRKIMGESDKSDIDRLEYFKKAIIPLASEERKAIYDYIEANNLLDYKEALQGLPDQA